MSTVQSLSFFHSSALVRLLSIGTGLGILRVTAPSLFAVGILGVVAGALVYLVATRLDVSPVWPLLAFALPLLVAGADAWLQFMPQFPDAALYDRLGWATTQAWRSGDLLASVDYINLRVRAYASVVGAIYFAFGHQPLAPIAVNAGLWGLTTAYWLRIGVDVFDLDSQWLPGLFFVFYPGSLLYVSAVLREAIALFCMTLAVVHLLAWLRHGRRRAIIATLVFSGFTGLFRPELVPALWVAPAGALLYSGWNLRRLKLAGTLGSLGVALFGLVAVVGIRLPRYMNPSFFLNLETLEAIRRAHADRPEAYLVGLEYTTWIDVIATLPVRTFYFLISPFPWVPAIFDMTIAAIDGLFLFVLAMVSVFAVSKTRIRFDRLVVTLALIAVVLTIGFSLVISTPSAARRRLYVVPILILFAGLLGRRISVIR